MIAVAFFHRSKGLLHAWNSQSALVSNCNRLHYFICQFSEDVDIVYIDFTFDIVLKSTHGTNEQLKLKSIDLIISSFA